MHHTDQAAHAALAARRAPQPTKPRAPAPDSADWIRLAGRLVAFVAVVVLVVKAGVSLA